MYEKFFGLQCTPFTMVPDPNWVHVTGQHADVISGAVFGILERRGCIALTGEAGLGKTTAIRAVIGLLEESNARVSLISHPTLDAADFLELAMLNFGLPNPARSKAQRLKTLEAFLHQANAENRVCALIVDEAHKLPPAALEEIRLLGNFETGERKLLQILLVGQEELNARLDLPELWQLKQRIAYRLELRRLNREGVEDYLLFRWKRAGGAKLPFTPDAMDALATWSLGIPRVLHAICDNALMLALSDATRTVGVELIQEVCVDLRLQTPAVQRRLIPVEPEEEPAEAKPVLVQKAAAASLAAGTDTGAPMLPVEPWSAAKPSLFKKWLGFLNEQESEPAPKGGLPLKRQA